MSYLKRTFSWREVGSSYRLMLLVLIALSAFSFVWGEKTPASNGLGWDGVIYGDLVRGLDEMIRSDKLSNYYAHRSLPAFVVRSAMQLFVIPMTDMNIVKTFEVLNFFLLLCIMFVWKKIANHFHLGLREHWIGFCGLFLSFSFSKFIFYLPVLTDVSAMFIAMLLLYFYLKKSPFSVFLASLFGAFCWPGVALTGCLLILFMNFKLSSRVISPEVSKVIIKDDMGKLIVKWAWITLLASVLFRILFKVITPDHHIGAFLTGIPTVYFLAIGLLLLLGSWSFFSELWASRNKISAKLAILSLASVSIPFYLGKIVSNPDLPNPNTPVQLLQLLFFPPDNKFFLAPLTLSLFWGPAFLLMIIFWKYISIELRKLGPAPMAVVAVHLPLGLGCEPRFFTLIWPFLLIGLLLALRNFIFRPFAKKLLIILTIIFSKFWLIINWNGWSPGIYDELLKFPKQLLFMQLGLWTSWPMYQIQLPLVILCWYLVRKSTLGFKN